MHIITCLIVFSVVPHLLTIVESIAASQGQSISIDCIPIPNNTMIRWLHNGKVVLSSERVTLSPLNLHHTLAIGDLSLEDSGVYTCYVEGTKMLVNKTVNITVSEGIHTSMYACIRLYLVHTYTV